MNITLLYAPKAREVIEWQLTVDAGCTARQALDQTDCACLFPEITEEGVCWSVWGRRIDEQSVLKEGDRLELCRRLRVDPKVARRERFVGQGARGAGLFALRRPGSKAGY
jgi:uncharacterized protein